MKKRLDVLLVERGLATSREKAKAMIMAGEVLVDNEREDKAGSMFPEEVEIVLKGKPLPYATASSTGSCGTIRALSVWSARTSVTS